MVEKVQRKIVRTPSQQHGNTLKSFKIIDKRKTESLPTIQPIAPVMRSPVQKSDNDNAKPWMMKTLIGAGLAGGGALFGMAMGDWKNGEDSDKLIENSRGNNKSEKLSLVEQAKTLQSQQTVNVNTAFELYKDAWKPRALNTNWHNTRFINWLVKPPTLEILYANRYGSGDIKPLSFKDQYNAPEGSGMYSSTDETVNRGTLEGRNNFLRRLAYNQKQFPLQTAHFVENLLIGRVNEGVYFKNYALFPAEGVAEYFDGNRSVWNSYYGNIAQFILGKDKKDTTGIASNIILSDPKKQNTLGKGVYLYEPSPEVQYGNTHLTGLADEQFRSAIKGHLKTTANTIDVNVYRSPFMPSNMDLTQHIENYQNILKHYLTNSELGRLNVNFHLGYPNVKPETYAQLGHWLEPFFKSQEDYRQLHIKLVGTNDEIANVNQAATDNYLKNGLNTKVIPFGASANLPDEQLKPVSIDHVFEDYEKLTAEDKTNFQKLLEKGGHTGSSKIAKAIPLLGTGLAIAGLIGLSSQSTNAQSVQQRRAATMGLALGTIDLAPTLAEYSGVGLNAVSNSTARLSSLEPLTVQFKQNFPKFAAATPKLVGGLKWIGQKAPYVTTLVEGGRTLFASYEAGHKQGAKNIYGFGFDKNVATTAGASFGTVAATFGTMRLLSTGRMGVMASLATGLGLGILGNVAGGKIGEKLYGKGV